VGGRAREDWAEAFSPDERVLVFCDCEGAERELFDPRNVRALRHAHLVIELHNTFDHIVSAFAATHEVRIIVSTDDDFKAQACESPLLRDECATVRRGLVAENRHWTMAWASLRPKGQSARDQSGAEVTLSLRPFLD
jgi:hypothetical protein